MKVKIDLERDNNLTPFGIATVQDRYLDKNETSPQHAFARASKYVSTYRGKTDWEMAQRIYDLLVIYGLVFLLQYYLMQVRKKDYLFLVS